jgi:ectoine hydroxylase-related dioxygenase (phytanoyl-CoA dioxygenase family)
MTTATGASIDTERFHREGWLGPFELYRGPAVLDVRAACERTLGMDAGLPHAPGHSLIHNSHLRDPNILALALDPLLTDMVCSLLGDDALLWRTHFWTKMPDSRAIPWHQDYNYWPIEPAVVITIWIAIDDSDLENACLNIIPGSHRTLLPHLTIDDGSEFTQQADPSLVPLGRALPIEIKAGNCIIFNERMLHHSGPNHSKRRRLGLAVRYLAGLSRVLEYDSEDHVLHPLRSPGPLRFNRMA